MAMAMTAGRIDGMDGGTVWIEESAFARRSAAVARGLMVLLAAASLAAVVWLFTFSVVLNGTGIGGGQTGLRSFSAGGAADYGRTAVVQVATTRASVVR